jgi:hypothetical protein
LEDKSVVSAADRADFLEVIVFAGGDTKVSLDDGTLLAQKAPAQKFEPGAPSLRTGPVPIAAAAADLATCPAACAWNDPTARVLRIAVVTAEDIITAGDLEVRVAGSPSVKRYLFSVHY